MKINGSAVRGTVVATYQESFSLRTSDGQYLAWVNFNNGRCVLKGSDGSIKMTQEAADAPRLGEEVLVVRSTTMQGVRRMWAHAEMHDNLK